MKQSLMRRFSWAIYLVIGLVAIVLLLLATFVVSQSPYHELFLNLAAELLAVALIFFLVDIVFLGGPGGEQERRVAVILDRLDADRINIYPTQQSMRQLERDALTTRTWEHLRLFAPVELWRSDQNKAESWEALTAHVKNGGVRRLWIVVGLPPTTLKGLQRPKADIQRDLEYVRSVLSGFDGIGNVQMHFYPPAHASVGLSAVIWEGAAGPELVAFGLATHVDEIICDSGFTAANLQLAALVTKWFDQQVFFKATAMFILQDENRSFSLRWPEVVEAWYGPRHVKSSENG